VTTSDMTTSSVAAPGVTASGVTAFDGAAPGLTVTDLVVEYHSGDRTIRPLDGLTFEVDSGEIVLLLGPSGSGKTTLLSVLGGLLTPTSGRVVLGTTEVTALDRRALDRYRRHTVGFVFQSFNLLPSLTARENIAAPLLLAGRSRAEALGRADELAARVGLDGHAARRPAALSGGEQQRVAIARGLAHDPALLVADEPTANLDQVQTDRIIDLLATLRADGRVVVVSSHDPRLLPIADEVVRMQGTGPEHAVTAQQVRYEQGETIFSRGDWGEHVYVIEDGEVELIAPIRTGAELRVTTLAPGQHFGELGPILGQPRWATARARTPVTLAAHSVGEFKRLRSWV
jgi:putative ABC transport system ATP-binding protein